MTGWRDIASAPRDGTRILVYGAMRDGGHYIDICPFYHGRWTIEWMDGHEEPTSWQPLPLPPTNGANNEG